MTYVRKTRDEYEIQSNHGYGWDLETTEETYKEAREQLRVYRENTFAPVRIVKRRVKIEPSQPYCRINGRWCFCDPSIACSEPSRTPG